MTETESNIRESLLSTLSFLASKEEQIAFAAKVYYASYQVEFACWWFDTFYPEEPNSLVMFSEKQLAILKAFTLAFGTNIEALGSAEMSIEDLQCNPQKSSGSTLQIADDDCC